MEGSNLLGPLTTAFTMAGSCSQNLNSFYSITTTRGLYYYAQGAPEMTTCFPSGYGKYEQDYYSPGICPSGYTVACSSKIALGSLTETVQTCCPTQQAYTCYTGNGFPGQPWHSTQGCAAAFSAGKSVDFTYFYGIADGTTVTLNPTTSGDGGAINAFSVQVRFQSTDFPITGTGSVSSTATVSTTSPTTAAPSATNSTTLSDDNGGSGGGLSVAASAGIGVGATVAVVSFTGGLVLFILRRRRRKLHTDPSSSSTATPDEPAEMSDGRRSREISEMDPGALFPPYYTSQYVTELPARRPSPQELAG